MISDLDKELVGDRPVLVYNERLLEQMLSHLSQQSIVAIDTESNSLFAYYPRVCLIQLSTPIEREQSKRHPLRVLDFLIDPLRLSLEQVALIGRILAERKTEVVMHAAENDIILLQREFGFQFPSVFDTQLAARFLGWKQIGLAALLETHFNVISDKRMQRTNWGERPLNPQQIAYAQMDTHYLLALRAMQIEQLQNVNRWQAAQDAFQRLSRLRAQDYVNNERNFWQMRVSREIDRACTGVLQALWEWREGEAQRTNRPPFKIMNDEVLFQLASRQPATPQGLNDISGLSGHQAQRYGSVLLQVIRTGQKQPIPQEPEPALSPEQMLDKSARRRFDKLRTWRNEQALQSDLAPELIFTNQTLIEIAQADPKNERDLQQIPDVGAWKSQTYGQSLLTVLNK
ncbi:MAG: HRDC domain-containing protein [Caldilineaceae bacterium]